MPINFGVWFVCWSKTLFWFVKVEISLPLDNIKKILSTLDTLQLSFICRHIELLIRRLVESLHRLFILAYRWRVCEQFIFTKMCLGVKVILIHQNLNFWYWNVSCTKLEYEGLLTLLCGVIELWSTNQIRFDTKLCQPNFDSDWCSLYMPLMPFINADTDKCWSQGRQVVI